MGAQTMLTVSDTAVTLDQVWHLAQQLRPPDRVRLVTRLAQTVEPLLDSESATARQTPRTSLRGLLADLGPAPSAAEIDEAQREMWAPRL